MSKYKLQRLSDKDSSWSKFCADWENQCQEIGENFNNYAPATMPLIRALAEKHEKGHWACSLHDGTRFLAACVAHLAHIPDYDGPVLRMRLLVPCPLLDYGALSDEAYADTLIGFAWGAIKLSDDHLKAKHVKFHMRSPSDMPYFRAFGKNLRDESVFLSTEMKGAWLYITKRL
jgi:hypothetical protein